MLSVAGQGSLLIDDFFACQTFFSRRGKAERPTRRKEEGVTEGGASESITVFDKLALARHGLSALVFVFAVVVAFSAGSFGAATAVSPVQGAVRGWQWRTQRTPTEVHPFHARRA